MSDEALYQWLAHCTVKVWENKKDGHGTGFFVAPGRVLTAAHVVKEIQEVEISWQGKNFTARKLEKKSKLDFVILQLPFEDHPCVLLDSRMKLGEDMYTYGYTDLYPGGDSGTFQFEGKGSTYDELKLKQGQVRPGFSGAPILNLATGAVCGLIIKTREKYGDLGGRAISLSPVLEEYPGLRLQQAIFHYQDSRWKALLSKEQAAVLRSGTDEWLDKMPPLGFTSAMAKRYDLNIFYLLSRDSNRNAQLPWVFSGPRGAMVARLAIDPQNDNRLYAGMTHGQGIYQSEDGGLHWKQAGTGMSNDSIKDMYISPFDRSVYAATEKGVWTSHDNGLTWNKMESLGNREILTIIGSPSDRGLMIFGGRKAGGSSMSASTGVALSNGERLLQTTPGLQDDGLFVTRDGGDTWETFPLPTINDAKFAPGDSRILYVASINDGLFVSGDIYNQGLKELLFFKDLGPGAVAVCPADVRTVIVGTSKNGVYLTRDDGASWQKERFIPDDQVAELCYAPGDDHHIIATTINGIFESRDNGYHWTVANNGLPYLFCVSTVVTGNGALVVATSGGGIFKRQPKQLNWAVHNSGMPTMPCLKLFTSANAWWVLTYIGIYQSNDQGRSWSFIGPLNKGIVSMTMIPMEKDKNTISSSGLLISKTKGETFESGHAINVTLVAATQEGKLMVWQPGITWREVFVAKNDHHLHQQSMLYSDKTKPGILYWHLYHEGIYRFSEGFKDPVRIPDKCSGDTIASLCVTFEPVETLFAGTLGGQLLTSTDQGQTWTLVLQVKSPLLYLLKHAQQFYAFAKNGEVYKLDAAGNNVHFTSLPAPAAGFEWITAVMMTSPGNQLILYVATEQGLYRCPGKQTGLQKEPPELLFDQYYINALHTVGNRIYACMTEGLFYWEVETLQ